MGCRADPVARFPFLALLHRAPAHGYELKLALEEEFGALLPPLNAGQVYTTLARLERDGLVSGDVVAGDARNKRVYSLTSSGRAALESWIEEPVATARLKDAFFIKLVLVRSSGLAEPAALIERQRREYLQAMRDLNDALEGSRSTNGAAELLLEGAALHLEADLRWLELCEERLVTRKEDGHGKRS